MTKFFVRKIDACKLEEIASTNVVIKMMLDLNKKYLGFKMTCPMGPVVFKVPIKIILNLKYFFHIFFNQYSNVTVSAPIPFLPETQFCATGEALVKTEGSKNFRSVFSASINVTISGF